jgi:hypothetical protein
VDGAPREGSGLRRADISALAARLQRARKLRAGWTHERAAVALHLLTDLGTHTGLRDEGIRAQEIPRMMLALLDSVVGLERAP